MGQPGGEEEDGRRERERGEWTSREEEERERERKAIQLLLLLLLAKGPKMRAKVSARAADPSSCNKMTTAEEYK